MEIVQCGNTLAAQEVAPLVASEGLERRLILGTDMPSGTGVIPLGMLRTISWVAALGGIVPERAVAMATGNTARLHHLNRGRVALGPEADLAIIDAPIGSSASTALQTLATGDTPAVSAVIVDGIVKVGTSRNTPPGQRPVLVPGVCRPRALEGVRRDNVRSGDPQGLRGVRGGSARGRTSGRTAAEAGRGGGGDRQPVRRADLSTSLDLLIGFGEELGDLLTRRAVALLEGEPAESFGKAAIVGLAGELEHAAALLHPKFGAPMRAALGGGAAIIPSAKKMGGPGDAIDVPLHYKDAAFVRSHFDAIEVRVARRAARRRDRGDSRSLSAAVGPSLEIGGLRREEAVGTDGLR